MPRLAGKSWHVVAFGAGSARAPRAALLSDQMNNSRLCVRASARV